MFKHPTTHTVTIIGGGPAGLMAAEWLAQGGVHVNLYDAMPSVGRKILIAGKGGLNLAHSEPTEQFLSRYGARRTQLEPMLNQFGPDAVQSWVHGLGIDTFIGSSGRIFPADMKAAPLLRAWLHRLRTAGVVFHMRHRWLGWNNNGKLRFETPQGEKSVTADAVILALGGGSWPKLGSTGAWVSLLAERGVPIAPLLPSNCGFDVGWTDHFRERFGGRPLKNVILTFTDKNGNIFQQQGEFIITETGVEGSLIYAASAQLRDEIAAVGNATIQLDLTPHKSVSSLSKKLARPRGSKSISSHMKSRVGITGVKAGLLHEFISSADFQQPAKLAAAIKSLPIPLIAPRPLAEAISSAGGVLFDAVDAQLMIRTIPGLFCAGEMLDWEAPTGGYLLTACLASGRTAAQGVLAWLKTR